MNISHALMRHNNIADALAPTLSRTNAKTPARGQGALFWGKRSGNELVTSVDVYVFCLSQEQGTNDSCDASDDDRIPKTVIHIAGLGDDGK